MTGPVGICNIAVITGTLVLIKDRHGDRRSGGPALKDTGENFDLIPFLSCGGIRTLSGFSPVKIFLYVILCEGQACGTAVNNGSQSLAV